MTGVAERGELAEWMISGSMLRAGILHALKDQIREFLTEGLLGRTREAAFHFKLTGWGCEYLDSALYTAAVEPKGRILFGTCGETPYPTSPEEPPLTKQLCGKVDALLRRPDCSTLLFLGALRDNHRPLLMTLALIGGASALISKSEPSLLTRFGQGGTYLAEFCFQSLRLYLGEWITQNTGSRGCHVLGVWGCLWPGLGWVRANIFRHEGGSGDGLLSYSGSLTRAGSAAPVHEYGDAFLSGSSWGRASLWRRRRATFYLKRGWIGLISRAPITYHFIRDFINRKIATPSPLEMLKEVQALVQGALLQAQVPGYLSWCEPPLMPLATLASEGSFGFVVHMMLPNLLLVLDALYQMLLLLPLQPGRLLLSRVLGQEARFTNQLYELVCGVCLATFQMGLFHALFSWLTLRLFGAGGACLFALLSGLVAVVPIGGPYVAILPPVLFMWFIEGRRLIPAFLFICHVVVAVMVDGAFYAHLPSVSPFYTALAAFLGYSCLGLQGSLTCTPNSSSLEVLTPPRLVKSEVDGP
ncbi:hypothetical protein L0F63_005821, partial [Massospora cicadina]